MASTERLGIASEFQPQEIADGLGLEVWRVEKALQRLRRAGLVGAGLNTANGAC